MKVVVTDFSSRRHDAPYLDELDYEDMVAVLRDRLPIRLRVHEASDQAVALALRHFMYARGASLDDVCFDSLTYEKED